MLTAALLAPPFFLERTSKVGFVFGLVLVWDKA
jgi:hypothetical protein